MHIADTGLWVFTERIGTNIGLNPAKIRFLLAITTALTLALASFACRVARYVPGLR